jgi:hypothetical protein
VTGRLWLLALIVAATALAVGYVLGGAWPGALTASAVAGLWWLARRRRWGDWTADLGLVSLFGAAAFGAQMGMAGGWMLVSALAALGAWDLDRFARRLEGAGRVMDRRAMEERHLRRLALALGVGAVGGGAALALRVRLSLGVAILLGLLAVIGLSVAVRLLRRESD